MPGYSVESWYGVYVPAGTPQELDIFVRSEEARWSKIIKDAGIAEQ